MIPRFLADENIIDSDLILGLRRRVDDIDVLRVREVGSLSIAQAIYEIAAIAVASDAEEWNDQIAYLPLR